MGRHGWISDGHALGETCNLPKVETSVTGFGGILEGGFAAGQTLRIDTIALLPFVRQGNEIARHVLILESRGVKHSNNHYPFLIADDGINAAPTPPDVISSVVHEPTVAVPPAVVALKEGRKP